MKAAARELWRRAGRSLVEIIVFAAAFAAIERGFAAIPLPGDQRFQFAGALVAKLPVVLLVWGLLWLRGESLEVIGLRPPRSWPRTLLLGSGVAVGLFVAVYLLERAGFRRDLRAFDFLKGNLELTLYQVGYVFTGAGFYEEFVYRGFIFNRLARVLGDGRAGWGVACVLQAIWFGNGHAYQGPAGVALTAAIGLLFGVLFLLCRRNLWPGVIAHGVYDAARSVLFYFNGPPSL